MQANLTVEVDNEQALMNNKPFGLCLRTLRKSKNLSVYALSKITGLSQSYLAGLEKGYSRNPSKNILGKLVSPLGISIEELMKKAGVAEVETPDYELDPNADIEILKTLFCLKYYRTMMNIIADYTYSETNKIEGHAAFDIVNAYKHIKLPQDQYEDSTANTIVMKEKRRQLYIYYSAITQTIRTIIEHVADPHESLIAKLLFIDGWKYKKARQYCEHGYRKDTYPISGTTFSEKRRNAIAEIAERLMYFGIIDLIEHDKKSKDGFKFVITNWTNQQD